MTAEELVRAADESFIASFRKLAQHVPEGETHEARSIFSFVTGLPLARRRGVGSAVTWAAIEAGRAWGYDTIVLQSSVMGLSMYSAMGFRTVAPYVVFADSSVG